jgi:seipin
VQASANFYCRQIQKPYAFIDLGSSIVSQQSYDIKVELDLPRSPPNLGAGNFMLDMMLLSSAYKPSSGSLDLPLTIRDSISSEAILFSSRRSAILTYQSRLVRLSKQFAGLPWYILGWRREAETLEIVMAEGIRFPRGTRNVPETIFLELQSRETDIEVYDVQLKLRARFSGLRWIMYNHRIFSFVVFTTAFWTAEIFFAILTWVLWNSQMSTKQEKVKGDIKRETDGSTAIKTEDDDIDTDDVDLSDTPRNFPTYGRQAPLRYVPKVKNEDDKGDFIMDETAIQPLAAEADDESEEPIDISNFHGGRSDSGIGTSFSEGPGRLPGGVPRRRSRGGT